MTRSVFSAEYDQFRELLTEARESNNLTQAEVATRLKRPQSFVSKYERGERRLDLIEFLEVARVLELDVAKFIHTLQRQMPHAD